MEQNTFSTEELMDYLDGNLSKEEAVDLKRRIRESGQMDLLYQLHINQLSFYKAFDTDEEVENSDLDYSQSRIIHINREHDDNRILVLDSKRLAAAKDDGYLCDIECEEYILVCFGHDKVTKKSLLDDAYRNKWMKDKGMPIYNIGRLLEKYHLSVARRYNVSKEQFLYYCASDNMLIAVVNSNKLKNGSDSKFTKNPDHAVVILGISDDKNTISLFDPQTGNDSDSYPLSSFYEAWMDSQNFLVITNKNEAFVYDPQPINVDDIELSPELIELGEAIAENVHEVWAKKRKDEGWVYGVERNDKKKENPDMRPYSDLSDSEKEYDRETAYSTLKLVQKIGFKIVRIDD